MLKIKFMLINFPESSCGQRLLGKFWSYSKLRFEGVLPPPPKDVYVEK